MGVAGTIGVRALLVHVISDEAGFFCENCGFKPSPVDPMTLMITIERARRMLVNRDYQTGKYHNVLYSPALNLLPVN